MRDERHYVRVPDQTASPLVWREFAQTVNTGHFVWVDVALSHASATEAVLRSFGPALRTRRGFGVRAHLRVEHGTAALPKDRITGARGAG